MTPIKSITQNINILPLLWELQSNPCVWNQHKARTESPDSPHYGLDDIWVRFAQEGIEYQDIPHSSIWYPATEKLPSVKELIFSVMRFVQGESLGGVLITRIPAGAECKRHIDGGWHARNYEKFAISIAAHPSQEFCFDDAKLITRPGELFWFDNQYPHWVTNPTDEARITLIMSIKVCDGLSKSLRST